MAEGREDLLRVLGYSEKAIEYIATDRNFGKLAEATVDAHHQGHRGDILKIYLKVEDGIIRDARFEHIGCMGLQASAAGLTTIIVGKTIEEAERIDVEELVEFLGGIPQEKMDCAELARDALRKAIGKVREEDLG